MEQLTAMEVINLLDKLEMVEPTKIYNDNIEDFYNRVFYKAFGLNWDRIDYLKDLRNKIHNMMDIIKDDNNFAYLVMV